MFKGLKRLPLLAAFALISLAPYVSSDQNLPSYLNSVLLSQGGGRGIPQHGGKKVGMMMMGGMPYQFSYGVNDESELNIHSRTESSDGTDTIGEYRVLLPNGQTQIVQYTSNAETGFLVEIKYENDTDVATTLAQVRPQLPDQNAQTRPNSYRNTNQNNNINKINNGGFRADLSGYGSADVSPPRNSFQAPSGYGAQNGNQEGSRYAPQQPALPSYVSQKFNSSPDPFQRYQPLQPSQNINSYKRPSSNGSQNNGANNPSYPGASNQQPPRRGRPKPVLQPAQKPQRPSSYFSGKEPGQGSALVQRRPPTSYGLPQANPIGQGNEPSNEPPTSYGIPQDNPVGGVREPPTSYGVPRADPVQNRDENQAWSPFQGRPIPTSNIQKPETSYGLPQAAPLSNDYNDTTDELPTQPSYNQPQSKPQNIKVPPTSYGIPQAEPQGYSEQPPQNYGATERPALGSNNLKSANQDGARRQTPKFGQKQDKLAKNAQPPPTEYGLPQADPIQPIFLTQTSYGLPQANPVGDNLFGSDTEDSSQGIGGNKANVFGRGKKNRGERPTFGQNAQSPPTSYGLPQAPVRGSIAKTPSNYGISQVTSEAPGRYERPQVSPEPSAKQPPSDYDVQQSEPQGNSQQPQTDYGVSQTAPQESVQQPPTDYGVPQAPPQGNVQQPPTDYGVPQAPPQGNVQQTPTEYSVSQGAPQGSSQQPQTDYGVSQTAPQESVQQPPTDYGVPQAPPQGSVQQPPTDYGVPQAPPQGSPQQPQTDYDVPQGAPQENVQQPPTDYGIPQAPPQGGVQQPPIDYGVPQAPPQGNLQQPPTDYGVSQEAPQGNVQEPPTDYGVPQANSQGIAQNPQNDYGFFQDTQEGTIVEPPTEYGLPQAPPKGAIQIPSTDYGLPQAPPLGAKNPGGFDFGDTEDYTLSSENEYANSGPVDNPYFSPKSAPVRNQSGPKDNRINQLINQESQNPFRPLPAKPAPPQQQQPQQLQPATYLQNQNIRNQSPALQSRPQRPHPGPAKPLRQGPLGSIRPRQPRKPFKFATPSPRVIRGRNSAGFQIFAPFRRKRHFGFRNHP